MEEAKKYIGRFFERNTGIETNCCVFKITGYAKRSFFIDEYNLFLGYSTFDKNSMIDFSFLDCKNFKEISEDEYKMTEELCCNPLITIHEDWWKREESDMSKTEMDKIKEDIVNRIDRGEPVDDVLKNSGVMQLNTWDVINIFADIFKMKGLCK